MAIVIGITGLAGSGKDSYASALKQAFRDVGVECVIAGFADPLRRISADVGLDPYTRSSKELPRMFEMGGLGGFKWELHRAIQRVLGDLPQSDRDSLYVNTLRACASHVGREGRIAISPREFMQIIGTEGGQSVRKTLWVDYQRGAWAALPGFVIVPDFRFYHELAPLAEVLNINRPGIDRVNGHASEDLPDLLTRAVVPVIGGKPVTYVLNDRDISYIQETAKLHAAMLIHNHKDSI
ncbi:hypothetical protein LMG3458_02483 [Achromobacter deleyi]|uniref:Deoxynucleotide monophosphate kinase n=1 Tax=Achromobacter deleyi TaxID=1353891 RepID=A0A6S6ZUL9_9BURK|nr:hypothetical protein [Achromobacter deleyi]CAB3697808.1 hypothetical protein LMG3458_02483 [Achromobacter deleyi]